MWVTRFQNWGDRNRPIFHTTYLVVSLSPAAGLTVTDHFLIPRSSRFLSARQPGWQKPTNFWYLLPRGFSQPGNRADRNRPIFHTSYLVVSLSPATGLTETDQFLIPLTSWFLSARQPGWQKLTNFWCLLPCSFSHPGNRADGNRLIFKTAYLAVSHCLATGLRETVQFL